MANTPTARLSTAPARAGPGRLLAGERAHYELAAGRKDKAASLLETFEASAGHGGLLPEQVWDGADMPERELWLGRPSGSAMPLVWAHSEHIKLLRSLRDGAVFDMPPQGVKRYIEDKTGSPLRIWRFNNKIRTMPAGKTLRVELAAPALVHWSSDKWLTVPRTARPAENAFGVHLVGSARGRHPAGQHASSSLFSGPMPAVGRMSTSPSALTIMTNQSDLPR